MKTCALCGQEKDIAKFKSYRNKTGMTLYKKQCRKCLASREKTKDICACGNLKSKKSTLCNACHTNSYIRDHKLCPGCNLTKSYHDYHLRTAKSGKYKTPKSYCKECCKARARVSGPRVTTPQSLCECGKPKEKRSKLCSNCNLKSRRTDYTLGEAIYNEGTKGSTYSLIRSRARNIMQGKVCERCGYSIHVEICHIKPINKFPLDAKLSEINHPDNLVALCRNHHWEFDRGLLTLDQIKS